MNTINKIGKFLDGTAFTLFLMLLSAVFVVFEKEAVGAIVLVNIGAVMLLLSDNLIASFFPTLLACTFVIKCYDSASLFMPLWYTAIFPVVAVVFYFIKKRRKITVGKSFFGILAVAVAVTLGGFLDIRIEEYFGGAALYYVLGLGFGMVLAYLLIRSQIFENGRYDIFEKYTQIMTNTGIFACFVVLEHYLVNISTVIQRKRLLFFQWSNNISTMLMFFMPFFLYKSRRNKAYLIPFVVSYGAILLTGSRGGLVMGSIEFLICIFSYTRISSVKRGKIAALAVGGAVATVVALFALFIIYNYSGQIQKLVSHDEARMVLFARSFEDFMANPIFGAGIGNVDNGDLYDGVKGTMCWYHMMIPQIVGSLGLVGMVCYGKQMVDRFSLAFKNASPYTLTLGLSYVGMLLMSQVNPGEFCPLPYELLVVVNFILIEKHREKIV